VWEQRDRDVVVMIGKRISQHVVSGHALTIVVDGPVSVLVVAAREDAVIARETQELLAEQR